MLFSQNLEMRVLSVLFVYSITKTVFAFCESSKTNFFLRPINVLGLQVNRVRTLHLLLETLMPLNSSTTGVLLQSLGLEVGFK